MFSLIITIVSIALVVALIGATMYYGGDTLTEGRAKSDAAAYISGGQQIAAALQMYNAMEGASATSLDNSAGGLLEDSKYLKNLPVVKQSGDTPGAWTLDAAAKTFSISDVPEEVCDAIEANGDSNGIYGCTSNTFTMNY